MYSLISLSLSIYIYILIIYIVHYTYNIHCTLHYTLPCLAALWHFGVVAVMPVTVVLWSRARGTLIMLPLEDTRAECRPQAHPMAAT